VQHSHDIPYPTPMERHLDNLPLHLGQTPRLRIGPKDRPAASLALLTPKPLLAITRSAILHDFCTLPMRTPHGFHCHRLSSFRATPALGPTPSSVHDDSLSYSNQQIRDITHFTELFLPHDRALPLYSPAAAALYPSPPRAGRCQPAPRGRTPPAGGRTLPSRRTGGSAG